MYISQVTFSTIFLRLLRPTVTPIPMDALHGWWIPGPVGRGTSLLLLFLILQTVIDT